jgi:polar amino acid transport system substrate-binding protein
MQRSTEPIRCRMPHGRRTAHTRIRLWIVVAVSILLLAGVGGPAFGAQTIRLATLNWAPYIGGNLPSEGYAAELIRTAFERRGYQVQFFYMPWTRAVKTVLEGSYDGLCPVYYTEQREQDFSLSIKFPAGPLVFFKRVGNEIKYNRLEDLQPYKIAVVRGYANTKEFDEADYLQKSFTNNDQTGYRRVLFGTVDLWLVDKFVAQYTMTNHLPDRAKELDFIDKPLGVNDLYVAFSKKKPEHKRLTKAFNEGLAEVLNDGTLKQVLEHHGLSLN